MCPWFNSSLPGKWHLSLHIFENHNASGLFPKGSHGAGHAHETLTPFVAWGAGVRGPVLSHSCGNYTDSLCSGTCNVYTPACQSANI